jgi:hypothetical protein
LGRRERGWGNWPALVGTMCEFLLNPLFMVFLLGRERLPNEPWISIREALL